jgi:Arc/MetJ-type ribon-helix-helix transcriptional regulator
MLQTSLVYGINAGMSEMRKITVEVPDDLLGRVQEYTGEGITDTVRAALKKLDGERAQQEFRKLRGSFKFSINLDELREDRTFSRKRK